MKRDKLLERIENPSTVWDMVVIGGGATGLGVAVDAATRGFSVVLFEQDDFAKSTSSRSTKLVHGGVRYLQKGDVPLVREALHERGRLRRNAPHLVKDQTFVISNYTHFDNFLYTCGLTVYDMLSWGGLSLGRSYYINREKVMRLLPGIKKEGLKGGVVYHDGQFDDSRLAINLAQTCCDHGGCPLNHFTVMGITHHGDGKVSGVTARDNITGREYTVRAKTVVNAAGIFVDDIMTMDSPSHDKMVTPSQGVHIVLDMKFLQSDHAIMIPKTSDGRVLFAVPWHDKVVVGTTDIVREVPESEPKPLDEEIDFILATAGLYIDPKPTRADILSVFAGQRPLAAPKDEGKSTKEISRSHKIIVSKHNLITITGGKWTTYRRMAQDTVDKAVSMGLLPERACATKSLRIHGYKPEPDLTDHMYIYGSDADAVRELVASTPEYSMPIHASYPYKAGEAAWAVREEMALTVEDILARRVRLLFLDARAAIEAAPAVAAVIAREGGMDKDWAKRQVEEFTALARNYII
ncbi:MAG: glycerol-3-phosphate dehydrogenase/oxidase [Rikenellaceae bacterium]|nr:glycerol-3-phosphate dehydrogenase/oxidase [Rikenellaceae bacterium]